MVCLTVCILPSFFFFFLSSLTVCDLAIQEKITGFGETRRREKKGGEEYTLDGSVDRRGHPAIKGTSGGWRAGILILGILYSPRTHILPAIDFFIYYYYFYFFHVWPTTSQSKLLMSRTMFIYI